MTNHVHKTPPTHIPHVPGPSCGYCDAPLPDTQKYRKWPYCDWRCEEADLGDPDEYLNH